MILSQRHYSGNGAHARLSFETPHVSPKRGSHSKIGESVLRERLGKLAFGASALLYHAHRCLHPVRSALQIAVCETVIVTDPYRTRRFNRCVGRLVAVKPFSHRRASSCVAEQKAGRGARKRR